MQYMIANYVPTERFAKVDNPQDDPDGPAWGAYIKALIDAGVLKAGNALHGPHTATTVRMRDGKKHVQDGPYADSKEQMGGYFIIEVPNLDVALEWAAKNPAAFTGCVEVRAIYTR